MAGGRADTDDYASLFLADVPLLDTRAPVEFARGAFPAAVNLPLMSDEERAAVGTCYKARGQAAAIELGHELVAGAVRDARIDAWQRFAEAHPEGYLYCFRGGLRSQIVQQWLAGRGIAYPRVRGGYKAMRRFLIDSREDCIARMDFVLVGGATGSGKTRVIERLARAVDLEGLARHRGSAFGHLVEEQPSQIDFENALAIELLRLGRSAGPVFLEDEGRLIGRIALPESLRARMAAAPLLVLEVPFEARVDAVVEDYIEDLGRRFRERYGDEGPARHREHMLAALGRTRKRLGGERHREIEALMRAAFDAQAAGDGVDPHRAWIRRLLADYYDPMYAYQLGQRDGERLFTGDREAVLGFAAERLLRA
jgi:tRNA 2-selenouridine synthase